MEFEGKRILVLYLILTPALIIGGVLLGQLMDGLIGCALMWGFGVSIERDNGQFEPAFITLAELPFRAYRRARPAKKDWEL